MRIKTYHFLFIFLFVQCQTQHPESAKGNLNSKEKDKTNTVITVLHLKQNYLKDEQIHFTLLTRKEKLVCSVLLEEFNHFKWQETGWSIESKGLRNDKSVQLFELKANEPLDLTFTLNKVIVELNHNYRIKLVLMDDKPIGYSSSFRFKNEKEITIWN